MKPVIIAHRGAMTEAPENTKSAFDKALQYRADGIEFDVQITKDRVPVVFHDATLEKINGSVKSIPDFTFDELFDCDCGSWFSEAFENEKILTLDQVLKYYGHRTRLMIEIKSSPRNQSKNLYYELALMVVDMVRNRIPRDRVSGIYILSFDPEIIKSAFMNDPQLNYVLNLHTSLMDQDFLNIDPEILCGYCIEQTLLNRDFVEKGHDEGKLIMTYSCNSHKDLERLLALDVDVIMTDEPGHRIWKDRTIG